MRVSSRSLRVDRRGVVKIKLSCPRSAKSRCAGRMALQTAGKLDVGAERKLLMLGRSSFALAPGSTKPIAVKLSRSVRSKLEQIGRRRISVRLTVRTRSESTRRRLTLRLPSVKSAGSASSSAPPAD